ncbi:MAG: FGGY-family carbohydrate kinase [Candidatus Latescibacterota bacterium]|jgi:xylulokinase
MGKYLGIDASTQSMTGLIIDTDTGRLTAEKSISFDAHLGPAYGVTNGVLHLGDGVVHSAPLMWIEALDLLLRSLCDDGHDLSRIEAVSGSGQQHGTVYLNDRTAPALAGLSSSRPLRDQLAGIFSRATAPVWMDTSTGAQCRELEEAVGGRQALLELTGNTAFERFSGPQIRKFFQTDPAGYAGTACICLVSSFVASLLAGTLVPVDPGDGSGTNLMDIRTRRWSPRALAATAPDLDHRLLSITPATRVVGRLSPYFVGRYGFSPDCLVVPFSGDNPCSLIGLGLIEPGQVALSLGTSDTLFVCMDAPRVSAQGEGAVFASPDDRHYMALVCFLNGSLAREAIRDQFKLDWAGFGAALQATPPGNGGGLMLPYFAPEIVPRVPRAGVVSQGLPDGNAAAAVRAVIEAQALSSRLHSRWMGVRLSSLNVTGGASANREILQVYADVHGCPARRFETTNAAALGAALRACYSHRQAAGTNPTWKEVVGPFTRPAAGATVEPDPGTAAIYEEALARYEALEQAHLV